jgi:ornithine--oxo-acid transaminase
VSTAAEVRQDRGAVGANYAPLPVTIQRAEGVWVEDVTGRRYLDFLAAYSALNFGHRHPRLVAAAHAQLDRLTLTSRAFGADDLAPFCSALAALCGKEAVVPMNSGAEAVETAIKIARRWGYRVKGVAPGKATVVVFDGNFHGRTTTIVGFSDDPTSTDDFGPFTPGFVRVPFGDIAAVRRAVDQSTVAVLVEPIQGEAGVVIPPDGFLRDLRRLCDERDMLLMADEIQSGLGRTGRTFACDHEDVEPDLYIVGKALGGGIVPLSAVVGDWSVIDVLTPGSHGSTFGGNPLACAIGLEVVAMLATGELQERSAHLGGQLARRLGELPADRVSAHRSRGLWAGVDVVGRTGRDVCERLLERGVLCKDAHGATVRISPPLTIDAAELDWGLDALAAVLAEP